MHISQFERTWTFVTCFTTAPHFLLHSLCVCVLWLHKRCQNRIKWNLVSRKRKRERELCDHVAPLGISTKVWMRWATEMKSAGFIFLQYIFFYSQTDLESSNQVWAAAWAQICYCRPVQQHPGHSLHSKGMQRSGTISHGTSLRFCALETRLLKAIARAFEDVGNKLTQGPWEWAAALHPFEPGEPWTPGQCQQTPLPLSGQPFLQHTPLRVSPERWSSVKKKKFLSVKVPVCVARSSLKGDVGRRLMWSSFQWNGK